MVWYVVSFERRVTLLASGHASSLAPIDESLGRTVSALYWDPPRIALGEGEANGGEEMGECVYGD